MKHRTDTYLNGADLGRHVARQRQALQAGLARQQRPAITDKREAEAAKDAFMAPLAVADEAKSLAAITTKLEGRKAELVRTDEQQIQPCRSVRHGLNSWLHPIARTLARRHSINTSVNGVGLPTG